MWANLKVKEIEGLVPRKNKNVILYGKGSLAVTIATLFSQASDFHLLGVVPAYPEPTWTSSLSKHARESGWNIFKREDIPKLTDDFELTLGFSCFSEIILSVHEINLFERFLNLHNGPLPKYRGVNPVNWALKNGENFHGVTIHEVTDLIDAGPILGQILFGINPKEHEVIDVYKKCLIYGENLFKAMLPDLLTQSTFEQDETKATYYSQKDQDRLGERRDFFRNVHLLDKDNLNL